MLNFKIFCPSVSTIVAFRADSFLQYNSEKLVQALKIKAELPLSDKVKFSKFCDLLPKKCVATESIPSRSM